MQDYITVKEYALRMGISERAVQKQIARGEHRVKEIPHPKRSDLKSFLIYIGENNGEPIDELYGEPIDELYGELGGKPQKRVNNGELSGDRTGDSVNIDDLFDKLIPCETELRIGEPIGDRIANRTDDRAVIDALFDEKRAIIAHRSAPTAQKLPATTRPKKPRTASKAAKKLAAQKALFCDDILALERTEEISRSEAISQILELYTSGLIHPGLYSQKGSISHRTAYNWLTAYEGKDSARLIEKHRPRRGHTVLEDDLTFICGCMMSSSDRSISGAIKLLHIMHRKNGSVQGCSDRTLRRAFEAWKVQNNAIYTMRRYGEKYVKEHLLPYIEQDWSLVKPGELWFSDGHKLNFPVLNPYTGKPERPMLITWFDAATRFPGGFDIDFTENQRVVASSFLNAISFARYCPRYIKIDNGLAFRAKTISGKLSKLQIEELKEAEEIEKNMLQGALYRCGVERVSFGKPYNSTSKAIIERWHGTLDTGLQAFLPNYSGNSVANKPARLHRNEKFLQSLETKGYLTVIETKLLIEGWIMDSYGQEPHSGIGTTPLQAWQDSLAEIPAEQRKSPDEFFWLMLTTEIKKLGSQGVKVRGISYWAEPLIDYVGQAVSVRYSQMDDRYVYIFRSDGTLICRAEALNPIDPLASLRPEKGLQAMELTNRLKDRSRIIKKIKKATVEFNELTLGQDDVIQGMIESQTPRLTVLQPHATPEFPAPNAPEISDQDRAVVKDAIGETFRKLGITE